MTNNARRSIASLLATILLLLCVSCGSGSSPVSEVQALELQRIPTMLDNAGFNGELRLQQHRSENGLELDLLISNAVELHSLAVEISYDPQVWQLASAESSGLLGGPAQLIDHSLEVRPGLLAHGQVLLHPESAGGFTGSGCIAHFRLAQRTDQVERTAARINADVQAVEWDEGNWSLSWNYANTGDYDQNSEVNIADLTPIGIHFGESVADPMSAQAIIDGDGNTEINIADITPIGVNYGSSLSGYRIWELAAPPDWLGVDDTPLLADVAFAEATGLPAQDLLHFSYSYAADPGYRWLRLAPYNADETGTPTDYIFTYPSIQPLLALEDSGSLAGSGSEADPYRPSLPASIALSLLLPDDTDVSSDPLTEYLVSGAAGATISGNMLELDPSAAGSYQLTASHDGVPSRPYALHFHVNEPPQALLSADPASGHVPFNALLDASASSDPDGEIVLVEWDFENDGIFDRDTGTTLTTLHRYDSVGDYEAVVRLTDDSGAVSVSAPLTITVEPPNQAPQALFSADPISGNTPLPVSFDASASNDPDGSIVSFDWDFDNDGTYEISEASDPGAQHTYTVPGDYEVVLRVRDDDGALAFSAVQHINVGGNFPPLPVLRVVPGAGPSPLLVELDATESTDPDGSIVLVEWDFSGDGEYDQSGTQLTASNVYTGDGTFHPVVRLTDNNGGVAVSEPATVTVGTEAGSPPVALLSGSPLSGAPPLLVSLDGSASSDPDNDIVLIEFDFENDGIWDVSSTDDFTTQHEYAAEGNHEAVLRLTDSYGFRDTSEPLAISVSSGQPPEAFYTAASYSGTAPFDVVASAAGSTDPDGPVALYEWDPDDDGIYEYASTEPAAQFSLISSGQYTISLRVTDDDGMTDTYSRDFTVSPATLGWQDWNTGIVNPQNAMLRTVGGRASVAWQASGSTVYFKRSADADGHNWPVTGMLVDADLNGYPDGSMRLLDFSVSGGVPLLLSLKGTAAQADHDMFVLRGLNSDGSDFALPQKIVSGPVFRVDRDNRGLPLLADYSGLPGVSYGSDQSGAWHHIRALDSTGSAWQASPVAISGSLAPDLPLSTQLQDPAGGALLVYHEGGMIVANRDPDGNGQDWNGSEDLLAAPDVLRLQSLSTSDSVLLVYTVLEAAGQYSVHASHARSPLFSDWTTPVEIVQVSSLQADAQLLLDNGKPVLLFTGNPGTEGGVHYMRSHDARGSAWSQTLRISSQSGGELRGAAIVNGRLAAIHLRSTGNLRLLSRE
ncbi:MAG: PKD domain-containing protein [bacterium]